MKASIAAQLYSGPGELPVFGAELVSGVPDESNQYLLLRQYALVSVYPMIENLRPMEQIVIIRRFGLIDHEAWTLERTGDYIHRSRERVRQIEREALDKLRLALGIITKREYSRRHSQAEERSRRRNGSG